MRLYNRYTGESIEMDNQVKRLCHMRRRVTAWVSNGDYANQFMLMLTLTLREQSLYKTRMVENLIDKIQYRYGKKLIAYAWSHEMQKRGVSHFHLLLVFDCKVMPFHPDSMGWWEYGTTQCEIARTPYYILKYQGKEYQKTGLPKGARMFAVWVGGEKSEDYYWSTKPRWLDALAYKMRVHENCDVRRLPDGSWSLGGEYFYSPWTPFISDVDWSTADHVKDIEYDRANNYSQA
jgi:hypothetical protein